MREATSPASDAADPRPAVLVVDDEQGVRDMLKTALERAGFSVRLCADPLQAEGIAAEFSPDAFILDLTMPGLTGMELCERLRAGERFSNSVIIMMTGKVPGTDRGLAVAHGLAVGADDYLLKPFDLSEVVARLRARLEARREREQATARAHFAEREHRAASDRAEHYLHAAGVMLVALDADGRVTMINRKGLDILGYGEPEVLGQDWFTTFLPERMREDVRRVFDQMIAGEVQPVEHFENPVLTANGEERLIAWHNSLLRDEHGRISGTLSSGEDITERKRAEELVDAQRVLAIALTRAADLTEGLRLCLETAMEVSGMDCGGVYLVDESSGSLDLAFSQGLSPDFLQHVSHYDAEAPSARLVLAGKTLFTQHKQLDVPLDDPRQAEGLRVIAVVPVSHDGRVIACLNVSSHTKDELASLARAALEAIAAQIGSAVARLTAEASLRESEERFRAFSDASFEGIIITEKGTFVDANREFLRLFGYSIEELRSMEVGKLVAPADQELVMSRVLADYAEPYEHKALHKDGSIIDVEVCGRSVVYQGRQCRITALRDITERKQAEREQHEHAEHLEEEARRARQLAEIIGRGGPHATMIGEGPAHQRVLEFVQNAGRAPSAVLILGESGTGKEVTARSIHAASDRARQPFVVVDCAALKGELLESELFGHQKGAFTGAISAKTGLIEVADDGTLFVDEIGEMPLSLQSKLLRVLERGEYRRLGSVEDASSDLRVIAATNRDLATEVQQGLFRRDLYYRLNVLSITLPPLRERREDIPLLAMHFLRHSRVTMQIEKKLQPKALRKLQSYSWPGNIRELANVLERAVILSGSHNEIRSEHLPTEIRKAGETPVIMAKVMSLADAEKQAVVAALAASKGNKTRAAEVLGVSRLTIRKKIEKYRLGS